MSKQRIKNLIINIILPFVLLICSCLLVAFSGLFTTNKTPENIKEYKNARLVWTDFNGRQYLLDEDNPVLNLSYYVCSQEVYYKNEENRRCAFYVVEAENQKTGEIEETTKFIFFMDFTTPKEMNYVVEEFETRFEINITVKDNREKFILDLYNVLVNAESEKQGVKEAGFYYDDITDCSYRMFVIEKKFFPYIWMRMKTLDGEVVKGETLVVDEGGFYDYDRFDFPKQGYQLIDGEWIYRYRFGAEEGIYKINIKIEASDFNSFVFHDETIILNIVK